MKLWRVDNRAASWGDNEAMIIVAATAERALEIFDIEDRTIDANTILDRKPWDRIDLAAEEIPWPREEEGVLLISNIGS